MGYLSSKRWFGDKGRSVREARFTEVIPVDWPGSTKQYGVARASVTTDAGTSTYQLFVLRGTSTLTDALEDPEFRRGLADAFHQGARFEHNGTLWVIQSESRTPLVVPPKSPVTLSSSEQTNSSVVIDAQAILKLYRKVEPGIHPDVEVTRFLTIDRQFVHVPVLLGTIRFEDANGVTIAGMLQELVPGAAVGWEYALERSREYFAGNAQDADFPFQDEAEQLGRVTRALHQALASGDRGSDFDFRPATKTDVAKWVSKTGEMIAKASSSIERAIAKKQLRTDDALEAESLIERVPDHLAWIARVAEEIGDDAGANTRTHGDYHLGQVLWSAAKQFLVIDFEGEPLRPLRERRDRHSPLRDVAGMLRSFAYAAAMGSGRGAVGSKPKVHSPQRTSSTRADQWEYAIRDAFLRGYLSERDEQKSLLPRARANAARLLSLFETEKAFYELQYELDHRPEWVGIPLRGIAKLHA